MKKYLLIVLLSWVVCCPGICSSRWMASLPDDAQVCMLSIPGTHDSATGNGFEPDVEVYGERFARTQDLDIARQWKAGVRAFDLRPCSRGDYLHINHSIIATSVRFDEALLLLRDLLAANPSEFAVVMMNHESDGDAEKNYDELVCRLLKRTDLGDCLAEFRSTMTVGEVRGKILIISRDRYAEEPIAGGFFAGWTGSDSWERQTRCRIVGKGGSETPCYVQDCWETCSPESLQTKVKVLTRLLAFSTRHASTSERDAVWYFNMASAYALADTLFGNRFALSDGYRLNATHTNAAVIEHLKSNPAGPTGILMADYAGVNRSRGYKVRGKELVRAIIANNFAYLKRR